MLGLEAAAVVAQPDIITTLAQKEREAVVVVAAVCAGALQQAVDHEDGIFPLAFSRPAGATVGGDMGKVLVGEDLGGSVGALGG